MPRPLMKRYASPNEYIEPSEIDTFHIVAVGRNGLFLFPNGTDETPLSYHLNSLQPTESCKSSMIGRESFVEGVRTYLQKIVR